ncbi:MAG TPA: TonB-dependent receptor [Edaphobacter sp.]|nr:TonB-dependent receptor [Edaphobacter sp.]
MKRFGLALTLLLVSAAGFGQEFRATISGHIVDASGAVVPKAKVTVANTETGTKVETLSNGSGDYTAPFLLPGKYKVTATADGFSTAVRDGITVQTGDKLGIDISLAVGSMTQQVVVTADSALIQTETATSGQVLTSEEIENLPDNGRSPLGLAKSMYGVVAKQKNSVVQARPFDNSAASDYSLGGGNSQSNEYLLNGVPNMQDSSRLPGFSPLQDSVNEVRVDIFESDASYGDTSGGTVNLVTKAGTNAFHGSVNEFNQFSAINAPNRWFSNGSKQLATRQNQYGGTIGGPVRIPKVFDGRDKLFFFYAYEAFKGSTPNPQTTTVPTAAERAGDFSALLGLGTPVTGTRCKGVTTSYNSYQLFDPAKATADPQCPGQVIRQPIAGNVLQPSQLNGVAKGYLQYFPAPTQAGTADGQNNFYSNIPTTNNYNSHSGRLDYSLNDNNKIFFEVHRSEYISTSNNIFSNIATGSRSYTVYQGGLFDYVHTFSSSTTMDTRLSLTRSYKNSSLPSEGFDATSIGFPGYINSNASMALPRVQFTENGSTNPPAYSTLSTQPGTLAAFDTIQLFSALTKVIGKHTIKIGPDIRQNKNNTYSPQYSSGNFGFSNTFVSAGTTLAGPIFGGSFASFLLGIPASGSYNIVPALTYNNWYFSGFAQDDWKVTRHLTFNMGLRLESETSINESHDRAVVGFDPNATNSVTTAAIAAYAKSPIPELPVASFQPTGGLTFASSSKRYEYATAPAYVSPRFGFAYAPELFNDKLAIRGGFGLYVNPFNDYYTPQNYGYSSSTNLVATNNTFLTPAASLSDPFPATNPILQPTGSSMGVNTFLGQNITIRPANVQVPYSERWNLDVQFQLSKNTMIDVGYIGNHQVHLSYSNCLSCAPLLPFLSRQPGRDATVQNNLSGSVANPFKGLPNITGTLATASTISKYVLLQAYPQFGTGSAQNGVTQQLVPGQSATYNALLFRFQKRSSNGLTLNVNYTYSHNLLSQQLNPGGPLTYQENASDFPNHLSVTGVYRLPFGRGGKYFASVHPLVDAFIGGFTVNTIYQYLSGAPISWGNFPIFANGTSYDNSVKISPRQYFGVLDTKKFDVQANDQPSTTYNYRTFPLFYGRQDATNNLDASILKDFRAGERVRIQYRFEAFNVLNHTSFGTPNVSPTSSAFGTITSYTSVPRVLQQGLRVVF